MNNTPDPSSAEKLEIRELLTEMADQPLVFLSPNELDEAIIGVYDGSNHGSEGVRVVYDHDGLIEAYRKLFRAEPLFAGESDESIFEMAVDQVCNDTYRSIAVTPLHSGENTPMIISSIPRSDSRDAKEQDTSCGQ